MTAHAIEPFTIASDVAATAAGAFVALASAASGYLAHLDADVASGRLPARGALVARVRGTGPGVSFGSVVRPLEAAATNWVCPFEGSAAVSGAVLLGTDIVGSPRDDAFLLLRFQPQATDLPLHIHADSDRFILAVGGRGFFHVSSHPLQAGTGRTLRHIPVRDRDALMFRRGTVHTFSTAEHPLTLLSYHSPYLPLEDERQFQTAKRPEMPADFLKDVRSLVSFDPAWSVY